jgi:hypothetical protein
MRGTLAAGLIDMGCARPEPPVREKVRPPPLPPLRSRRAGDGGSLSSSSRRAPPPLMLTFGSVTFTMMTSPAEATGAMLLVAFPIVVLPPQLPLAHCASA